MKVTAHEYEADGTYAVTLIVNDGQADSNPSDTIVTITGDSPPVTPSLSVLARKGGLSWRKTRVKAKATVQVEDVTGAGVSGAIITATWAGAYSRSVTFVTDNSGLATSETKYVSRPTQPFIFTVLDVDKAGYISSDMPQPLILDPQEESVE